VRPIESAIDSHPDEPTDFDYTFFINPSELAAARGDAGALMRALETLRDRSTRTAAVGLECAHTSWFAASARLCRDAGIAVLLDLGFHDQYQELKPEERDFYRFCFNGLTRAERLAVPIDAAPQDHPIPWAFVGSLSPQRAALAWRLVHEASPGGFLYLPHLSPVTESGPHLNERQFQSVLRKARSQVWCSHHGHFYVESERFRNSLLTGGLPLKVMTAPAPPERILPFGNLMCTEQDAPAKLRQLEENYQTAWGTFADEFMSLPSLERGLAAFLEDEMGAAAALDAPHETGQSDARGARRAPLTKEQSFDRAAIQPA
jgi:hypothetical protein